ncbi:MAG: tRNA (guanosine(37)-N1)-methyltransferase TrmD [bacterium]
MRFDIITIFPQMLDSYFQESILGRAQKNKKIIIQTHDLRQWTTDKHKTVDDTPYGGGAGMVMKIEPLYKAIKAVKAKNKRKNNKQKVVLLSAQGQTWNQQLAKKYSKLDRLILICGRYEGVDDRVKEFIDEEISVGDYVLTGGELASAIMIDSISRLLPQVLGNDQSSQDESHNQPNILEYPQYTKPEVFKVGKKQYSVPKVLLSGNHKAIEEWRNKQKKRR